MSGQVAGYRCTINDRSHKTGLALCLCIRPTFSRQVENRRRSSWAVKCPSRDFKILSFPPIHNRNSFLFQPDGATFYFHVMAIGAASKPIIDS